MIVALLLLLFSSHNEKFFDAGYTFASYLSDPLLTAHHWKWQIPVTEHIYEDASALQLCRRKLLLGAGSTAMSLCSVPFSTGAVLLRSSLTTLQQRPFIHKKGDAEEKLVADSCTLLSWNLCCIPGGYSITDGNVLPWKFRMEKIVNKLSELDHDIICLYEIFDIKTAHRLIKGLQSQYAHFYYCIGPKAIGTSSGLFVASKMKIEDPEFEPFPKEILNGRSKFCNKGVFSFDAGKVKIFATHMGHSEMPESPTASEKEARKQQIAFILEKMERDRTKVQILTGDLNLDETEYQELNLNNFFERGDCSKDTTWCGDYFIANSVVHKKHSSPRTLDYTLLHGVQAKIFTTYIDCEHDDKIFNTDSISDHKGISSKILLQN